MADSVFRGSMGSSSKQPSKWSYAAAGTAEEPLGLPPAFSEEKVLGLSPAIMPGTPEAPLALPPAYIPGTPEFPFGVPPAPPALLLLRQDTLALWLLIAPPLALAALLLWLIPSYNSLPELMPLHFDANGYPDRIGERSEIWILPTIGAIVYTFNLLSGLLLRLRFRMNFAAYLLWGGALMVQILIWLAVWNITH